MPALRKCEGVCQVPNAGAPYAIDDDFAHPAMHFLEEFPTALPAAGQLRLLRVQHPWLSCSQTVCGRALWGRTYMEVENGCIRPERLALAHDRDEGRRAHGLSSPEIIGELTPTEKGGRLWNCKSGPRRPFNSLVRCRFGWDSRPTVASELNPT